MESLRLVCTATSVSKVRAENQAHYSSIGLTFSLVLYNNLLVGLFGAPPLTNTAGKWLWALLIPIYWGIAFVLGAGIPNFSGLTSVVAAFCILHFTYTFPPLLATLFWIHRAALGDGEGFDPMTGTTVRHDRGIKRLARGFASLGPKRMALGIFNIFYFFGALALAGLGAYSAITILITSFAESVTTSFVCQSPLDG